MEDSEILNMIENSFSNHFFIIYFFISDNDSTMWYVLKRPSKGSWGQFLKSSKEKLDEEILEPSFLVDPSHCMKVVSKHIFSIVNESRSQKYVCTKADDLQLNKYWGYIIKNNRLKKLKSWLSKLKFLLNTCLTIINIVFQSGA